MTSENVDPGYRLPSGDLKDPDINCLILFYPDRDEYRRALWGSLDYLGTWKAWERDDLKRGKDAASGWKTANELTWECFTMNTCETILGLLTEIEKNTRTCCGETTYVTYQNNLVITTTIVPGEGADPTVYGETPVADWDEWLEYVCYHAHEYVDDLIETAQKLDLAVSAGGYVLDFIAHLFSLVQWRMVEDIVPVNFSAIQAIFDALGQGLINNEFATLAEDLETGREDIVCALVQGTSLEDAVYSIVGAGVLWDVYYQWLDYETTTAVIYEGGIDSIGYLTPIKRSDCSCVPDWSCENSLLLDCSFESGSLGQGWSKTADATYPSFMTDAYHGTYSLKLNGGSGWPTQYVKQNFVAEQTGTHSIRYWNKRYDGTYSTSIGIYHLSGGSWVEVDTFPMDFENDWSHAHHLFSMTAGETYQIRIGNGGYHLVDEVKIYFGSQG